VKALLLDAARHLRGTRRATLIVVGGLMLAQAACLLVALFALALAAPDPAIPDPEHTVILDFKGNPPGWPSPWFTRAPVSFVPMLQARHVPLDLISRTAEGGMEFKLDARSTPAYLSLADPGVVTLLGLKSLAGDLRATLAGHDTIAISAELLRKLWGELPPAQAIGRRLQSGGQGYVVTAVIPDADPRSPIAQGVAPLVGHAMVMAGFDSQANDMSDEDRQAIFLMTGRVFARLQPGVKAEQIGGWMHDAFVANPLYQALPPEWRTGREAAFFRGVTLKQLPFEGAGNQLRWQVMAAVGAACLLLLVLAAFNAMNLRAADLLQRQRETALRRSLGANASQLVALWAAETLAPLLLSAAGALWLAWWSAPAIANWLGLPPGQAVADPVPARALAGLAVGVACLLPLTLAWPAWAALRRIPAAALQGRTGSEGPWGRRVRQGLLALQLGGALLLLSLATVLSAQQRHLLLADRGFDTHNRLVLSMETNPDHVPELQAMTAVLARQPAVTHWAFSLYRPAADTQGERGMVAAADGHQQTLRISPVSTGFFETYGMTVLAGAPQYSPGEPHMVIDAKAARLLGFATPQAAVGALLTGGGAFLQTGNEPRRVVAVVKDVTMESGRDPALPQAFLLTDKPLWNVTATGPDAAALKQAMEQGWNALGLQTPHEFQWADDQRAAVYRQEAQLTTTVATVSLLAVGVAMLGAYAMVADTLRRRRTELVLHRLHGASHAHIARQVAAEFGLPLAIAAAAALPLAAWLGWDYLRGFEDHIGVATGLAAPLLGAAAATALVTALACLRHVRQALALQPIEALR